MRIVKRVTNKNLSKMLERLVTLKKRNNDGVLFSHNTQNIHAFLVLAIYKDIADNN